jgi:NAD(P)-dependent dehydrogenase (short-subunit alcohol dehydrogenase family)
MTRGTHRRIVITGVTRGLGRALAERFIELGHTIVGCGRFEAAVADLRKAYGRPHSFSVVNVADYEAVLRWVQQTESEAHPPDLLVNNAALINRNARLWEVPVEEFAKVIDVNIKGVFHVVRAFLPGMLRRGKGVIVNLSSGWGRSTSPEVAPYCATKWAVEGLTQALAQELPSGLAAVAVNPGIIATDMLRSCFGSEAANYPTPDEWSARAVPFILGLGPGNNGQSVTVPL